jgi:hypothetical protein
MLTRLPAAAAVFAALSFGQFSLAQTPPPTPAPAPPTPAAPAVYIPTSTTPESGLPRTPDGRPDLQSAVWAANFFPVFESTPMSAALTVPEPEAKKMVEMMIAGFKKSVGPTLELDPEAEDLLTNVDGFPLVRGERRTRLVVLPADGKVPMKPEVRKEISSSSPMSIGALDNPEQRPINERCLALNARPPMATPIAYVRFQFVQTPTHVVIHSEDGDESRVIPYASEHPPAVTPNWLGDAIARWEGDTLVVETTNFPAAQAGVFRGASTELRVTERFTRASVDRLLYQFEVSDPRTWEQPWGGEYEFAATRGPIYEYACHEGNYALPGILSGARRSDVKD